MTLDDFLKYEVDDFDADSNYIYLKLDKDKYVFPITLTTKRELRIWAVLNFVPCDDEVKGLRVEHENNSKELEVYKKALDWLADRCEILDKTANPEYESICIKANRWKEVALQKARENNENLS